MWIEKSNMVDKNDDIIDKIAVKSNFNIENILRKAVDIKASDVHISVSAPPIVRVNGKLLPIMNEPVKPKDSYALIKQMLSEKQFSCLQEVGEIDLSYSLDSVGRFRVNVFKQKYGYCMALRIINPVVPSMQSLGLPGFVEKLCLARRGLILVTGPAGSGKSTTLASMVDYMNKTRNAHIVTIEDPIEYLHKQGTCLINQREVGTDTASFASALRASLRQDPDIILLGEMRDKETITVAIMAAETGHLVLTTMHTVGAVKTIDRIVDGFSFHQQQQVRLQLSGIIEAVISQQLLPTADENRRVVALETMLATPAIRNLIREGKTHQIQMALQTGQKYGMVTMDKSIINLYQTGEITRDTAVKYAVDREYILRELGA